MAVQPPYNLIPSLAQQRAQMPNVGAEVVKGLTNVGVTRFETKEMRRREEMSAIADILKNYDLLPVLPGQPPATASFGDVISARNRGRVPQFIPSRMLGLEARPKSDLAALSRILPSVIGAQKPGETVPVTGPGGLVQENIIPGLQGGATVTGKEKGGGISASRELDQKFARAADNARARLKMQVDAALVDPRSANVKNFAILDPRTANKEYRGYLKKELQTEGVDNATIDARLKAELADEDTKTKSFEKDLAEGVGLATKNPALAGKIKKLLLGKYPDFKWVVDDVQALQEAR